ncbi:hypothetical protein WCLP8_4870011 [uncultured Gammaproteobacteria bacterium]
MSLITTSIWRAAGRLVVNGPLKGARFALPLDPAPIILGRSNVQARQYPAIDFFFADPAEDVSVSRAHAQICRKGERFYLTDLGSKNGSYVNNIRLVARSPRAARGWQPDTTGPTGAQADAGAGGNFFNHRVSGGEARASGHSDDCSGGSGPGPGALARPFRPGAGVARRF